MPVKAPDLGGTPCTEQTLDVRTEWQGGWTCNPILSIRNEGNGEPRRSRIFHPFSGHRICQRNSSWVCRPSDTGTDIHPATTRPGAHELGLAQPAQLTAAIHSGKPAPLMLPFKKIPIQRMTAMAGWIVTPTGKRPIPGCLAFGGGVADGRLCLRTDPNLDRPAVHKRFVQHPLRMASRPNRPHFDFVSHGRSALFISGDLAELADRKWSP